MTDCNRYVLGARRQGAGSALVLHGGALWDVIDDWLSPPPLDTFTAVLPLLSRTLGFDGAK